MAINVKRGLNIFVAHEGLYALEVNALFDEHGREEMA
jgi:hypothetical protein